MYVSDQGTPVVLKEADNVVEERGEDDVEEREGGVADCEGPVHGVAEQRRGDEGCGVGQAAA